MDNKKVALFLVVLIVVVVAGLGIVFYTNGKNSAPSNQQSTQDSNSDVSGVTNEDSSHDAAWIEGLAKSLNEKGMVMYGAYWCSHCQAQKKMFGDAVQYIDYVECDPSGTNANPDECKANNVEGYPTWIYQGKQYSGEQSLEKLAEIIGYNQ